MVASISFMKFVMTFWTNQSIININYIFFISVLLLVTVFVKPTWNKKFQQVHVAYILKVFKSFFFHILTKIVLCLRNLHQVMVKPLNYMRPFSQLFSFLFQVILLPKIWACLYIQHSVTGQIQCQFSLSLSNRET